MLRIKKLDIFIIKSFLQLFIGTFFICLFIFMMQFLWRYVDELVGKGLGIDILGQFFFYSALTLIPVSLPLAILLAALMTFGNFGERYELLAMKAAGISLIRIISPLIIFCTMLACISFYFQNVISPKSQKQLWTLLVSMKQTSPELDIPERVFYSDIEGYNIYVKKKDRETGILKDILIYNFSEGFNNARIIWASEGKLEMTADKQHLYLHLYDGEQFENLRSESLSSENVPYRRESFKQKHAIIEFNGGFNMVDGNFLNERSDSKNMEQISQTVDSLTKTTDSIGKVIYDEFSTTAYRKPFLSKDDSTKIEKSKLTFINVDSLFNAQTTADKAKILNNASRRMSSLSSEWEMRSFMIGDMYNTIRKHEIDWHKKITLSLSCLIFFFIGAPLGAIIRKGGLGMPVVVSVLIFVLYYIIDSGATRIAKSGEMNIMLGVWMSTIVLAPMGAFFTYKSNKDSVVFNQEAYINFFRMLLGLRPSRHIFKKEVIITDPDYNKLIADLDEICDECKTYEENHRLTKAPNYYKIFTNNSHDNEVANISSKMETLIEELSNSDDNILLNQMQSYPILSTKAHKSPTDNLWLNLLMGLFVPVGIVFYFRIWRFSRRLDNDLQTIIKSSRQIQERIKTIYNI